MAMDFEEMLAMSTEKNSTRMMLNFEDDSNSIPMMSFDDSDDETTSLNESVNSVDSGYTSDETTGSASKKRKAPQEFSSLCSASKRMSSCMSESEDEDECVGTRTRTSTWRRCHSDSELVIKDAMKKADDKNLTGDFSRSNSLPTVTGKHADLAAISSQTMADVIDGKYPHANVTIVDCRYPYEYEGGHIQGAKNCYTKDQIMQEFINCKAPLVQSKESSETKNIIIFHCEFSSERGPKMMRFLRQQDRSMNKEAYPALHYPEIYILEGGYKQFWQHCNQSSHTTMCQPQGYTLMLDDNYTDELKLFRRKSKSFNGKDCGGRGMRRSRSRLLQTSLQF